jgi:hypothetical protein
MRHSARFTFARQNFFFAAMCANAFVFTADFPDEFVRAF